MGYGLATVGDEMTSPYYIEREIQEQPAVLRGLLTTETEPVKQVADAIRAFNPAFVQIAARGTSDNAARYAQYLMGIELRWPVSLAAPSINTLYHAPLNVSRALVIGISQSGRAADVRQVIDDARASGALTLTITNDPESPLALASEYHLALRCGEEISIAATKTYTAQLTAIALLVAELKGDAAFSAALQELPEFVAQALELGTHIPQIAQRYRYAERLLTLGRGYNYSTAFELAQKIRELCYMPVEDYSEADFRHGPIAMVNPGFPALVIAPSGVTQPLMIDLLHKLHKLRAECIVISDTQEALDLGHIALPLPADIPEWLSPICAVIPGQQLAMNMALVKGHPVDRPEGLNKVTITQ